jgi:HlyD family secretion protein
MSKMADLEAEVADLEAELERRAHASREKYAALERDRDLVENAMREASARAQRNEDNLKAVLAREEALKATLRSTQADLESALVRLSAMTAARDTACSESSARLRGIMAADARADVWQAAAADALAQVEKLRGVAR